MGRGVEVKGRGGQEKRSQFVATLIKTSSWRGGETLERGVEKKMPD